MGMNRPVSKKLSKVRRASGTNWAVISTNSPAQIAATIVSSVFPPDQDNDNERRYRETGRR